MARIRTIKPEFWTDEKIVELSAFARLLFIGLWNFADDAGRMEFSAKRLKMQIFPADDVDISALFGEIRGELVEVYTVGDKEFLQINGFSKHQKIDRRFPSKFPESPHSPPIPPDSPQLPPPEGNGKEGEGKKETTLSGGKESPPAKPAPPPKEAAGGKPKPGKRGTRMEEGWEPDSTDTAFAIDRGFNVIQIERLADGFRAHCADKGTTSKDWAARWRMWVIRDLDFHGPPGTRGKEHARPDGDGDGFAATAARVVARMATDGSGVENTAGLHGGGNGGGQGDGQGLVIEHDDAAVAGEDG